MPNTNTRWYRILLPIDNSTLREHLREHIVGIANVVNHSFISSYALTHPFQATLICTVIMNGSKASDDAAMFALAGHLVTDHGYVGTIVTVVASDTVYP